MEMVLRGNWQLNTKFGDIFHNSRIDDLTIQKGDIPLLTGIVQISQ